MKRTGNIKGLKAGVLGFGPIGMSVLLAARERGAGDIFVTDKIDERLSIAMNEGAAYTGNPMNENIVETIRDKEPFGLDVVFECCGQQEALDQAIDILKPGGKLMVVGIPEFDFWSVNVEKTRRREISILFVRRQENCTETALKLMNNGRLDVSRMVTHRFPFGQTKNAFDLVADYKDGVMKAIINF